MKAATNRKAQQHNRLGDILEVTKSIQQLAWFLTLRLNNHDFIYNEDRDMKAYDCIELLPFILLDNAIKYSNNGENIHILIEKTRDCQHVNIKSIGPIVYVSRMILN